MLKVKVKRLTMVASHFWLCGVAHDCITKVTQLHTPKLATRFQASVYSPSYNGLCDWLAQCMHSDEAYLAGYIRYGYPLRKLVTEEFGLVVATNDFRLFPQL
jgi:hypothetical protein